jgi:hypothetical protein
MKKFNFLSQNFRQGLKPFLFLFLVMMISPAMMRAEVTYKVTTKTGWKGTNADIMILLIGTKGAIEDYVLLDNPGRDDFEPRRTDVFTIYSQIDIGYVTDVWLKPRGPGLGIDNWKMESIEVENLNYPGKKTRFIHTPVIVGKEYKLRAQRFQNPPNVKEGVEEELMNKRVIGVLNFSGRSDITQNETIAQRSQETYSEASSNSVSTKNAFSIEVSTSFGDGIVIPETDVKATYAFEISTEFSKSISRAQLMANVETKAVDFLGEKCSMTFYAMPVKRISTYGTFDDGFGNEIKFLKSEGTVGQIDNMDKFVFRAVDDKANGDCTNCPTFKDLWVAAGRPLATMPNGPTLASRASLATTDVCYIAAKSPNSQTTVTPPPSPNPVPVVANQSASEVEVCDRAGNVIGYFKQNGNSWVETDRNGQTKFQFQETSRNQGIIHLADTGRQGVKINLDLNKKEVLYSDQNNTTPFFIYIISKVK